jgi:hypothetical protein
MKKLATMKRKSGMSKAKFLAGLLFLSGCANLFVEQPKTRWESLKQESRQCLMDIKSDRELKPIAHKVMLEGLYDRDVYFELLNIEEIPTSNEKVAIKKWTSRLERCYKIKAESYAYEPPAVAVWSAATDSEQLMLVSELHKGNLSYGQFAARSLEIDTKYRGQIMRAIAADYKNPDNLHQQKGSALPKTSSDSSCGWEGNQWVCRSL